MTGFHIPCIFSFQLDKGEKMVSHPQSGNAVRELSMLIVIDYMQATPACQPNGGGMTQAELFRNCGFEWENQEEDYVHRQQAWFIALLKVLEQKGKIKQLLPNSKKWELV